MTVPGVGAISAMAVQAFSPPMTSFRSGRDFAAWVGLTSKMANAPFDHGASAVVSWAARKGTPEGSWLARMMVRKPRMLIVVALASKMARTIWALTVRERMNNLPRNHN